MTALEQLERDAAQQRLELEAAFRDLRRRLTLPRLADEAVALLAPGRSRLAPIFTAARRHPMLAAALFAGASWLFKQGLDRRPPKRANDRSLET